jgi:hypothetical protein
MPWLVRVRSRYSTTSPTERAVVSSNSASPSMNHTGVPAAHALGTVSSTPRESE